MPKNRTDAQPKTKMIIWGRAAGRCQFPNCNARLDQDLISGNLKRNKAYVAHIVAAAVKGERGDPNLSPLLADDPDNLMLMCDAHHREIDDKANLEKYTVDVLKDMKRAAEERVDRLLSIQKMRPSTILQVSAPIGDNETAIIFDDCAAAVAKNRALADRNPIELKIRGMRHKDSDPDYYRLEIAKLRREFDINIRWKFEEGKIEHLSVFGLAPIPILIELGRLVSDISDATVYMRHREPVPGWTWPDNGTPLRFETETGRAGPKKVALKLSVSAGISDDRILAVLGEDVSIWEIRASTLGTTALCNQADLSGFREIVGRTFDRIKEQHGEDVELSVFPAIPAACAVEVGRVWQPKAHRPFSIFDQAGGSGFVRRHDISSVD